MTDTQLVTIFTEILDILDSMASDNIEHTEVRIIREHVATAAAIASKPLPFGSGNVSV